MAESDRSDGGAGSDPDRSSATPVPGHASPAATAGTFDHPDGPPPDDLTATRDEIETGLGPADAVGIAGGGDTIFVSLRPGREGIADDLLGRFGDRVQVDVGGIPWPMGEVVEALEGCGDPLPAGDEVDGVTAEVTPRAAEVPLGGDITGSVVVTNAGLGPVTVEWGGAGLPAHLMRPGTDAPVGAFLGMQTMQIVHATVAPGTDSEPLPIVVGVTSCTPRNGTAVQPGRYDLVAVVPLADGRTLRSAPAEITVTAP
jgi:hypothetical protein